MSDIIEKNAAEATETGENTAAEVAADEIAVTQDSDASEEDKGKLSAAVDKTKDFMSRHGNIWQIVKFTLISLIAFIAEFASMYALQYGLEGVCGDIHFQWFLFDYDVASFGLAGFIAMLVSKCIAEIISFTINRKKTFNANNNVVFSAIMYVITVIALILFTTWLAGKLGNVLGELIDRGISSTISKMLGSLISWVVIFLMDKFVIMRRVDKGEEAEDGEIEAAGAVAADVNGEAVLHDSDEE